MYHKTTSRRVLIPHMICASVMLTSGPRDESDQDSRRDPLPGRQHPSYHGPDFLASSAVLSACLFISFRSLFCFPSSATRPSSFRMSSSSFATRSRRAGSSTLHCSTSANRQSAAGCGKNTPGEDGDSHGLSSSAAPAGMSRTRTRSKDTTIFTFLPLSVPEFYEPFEHLLVVLRRISRFHHHGEFFLESLAFRDDRCYDREGLLLHDLHLFFVLFCLILQLL